MYTQRRSAVPHATVWSHDGGGTTSVLPDGCMDIVWIDGSLVVAGPDTHAHETDAADAVVGLRFDPGVAAAVLGTPAHLLRDLRVPLDELCGSRHARELGERLSEAGSLTEQERVLELFVQRWSRRDRTHPDDSRGLDPRASQAVLRLVQAGLSVHEVAARTGWSERQLRRRSLDSFGYGLATLRRVLRLQTTLRLVRSGLPLQEVAARAGFADQPHLTREVRALTGALPTELS